MQDMGVNAEEVPEGVTAPTTEDGSYQNTDKASAEGAQVLQADRKRDVELFFGYAGFELSNALRECDSRHDFTPAQVRQYTSLKNPAASKGKDQKTILAIHRAMQSCNFRISPLTPGAHSLGDRYENGFHWMTALHMVQPDTPRNSRAG